MGRSDHRPHSVQGFADVANFRMSPAPATRTDAGRRAAGEVSDPELLCRLLGAVLPIDPAPLVEHLLHRFGSFGAVLAAPEAELRKVRGLGTHCIAAIKLVHATAIRVARAGLNDVVLDDWEKLMDYLSAALGRERVEQFRVLFLDSGGRLRADEVQGRGTVNHTPVYPREIVRRAIELQAASVVLVHNHPSGDPTPSGADLDMTMEVVAAARAVGIAVRDHIVVGNGRGISFQRAGLLG